MPRSQEWLDQNRAKREAQCAEVDAVVKKGASFQKALEQVGMEKSSYYKYSKKRVRKMSMPKRKRRTSDHPGARMLSIPSMTDTMPFSGGKIFALVGAPKEIMEAIRSVL